MRICLVALLMLAFCGNANATSPAPDPVPEAMREIWSWASRDWPKVEKVIAEAQAAAPGQRAGVYESGMGALHLAADGRAVLLVERGQYGHEALEEDDAEPMMRFATLAQWRDVGDGIELFDPKSTQEPRTEFSDEDIAEFHEMVEENYAELSPEALVEQLKLEFEGMRWDVRGQTPQKAWMQLLAVEDGAGVLLLNREWLLRQAQRWDGRSDLKLQPDFWRAAGPDSPLVTIDKESPSYELADPLHSSVPQALRGLLRPETIDARVLGRTDPEAPIPWKRHYAEVELRLDRGSEDGLIQGMSMFGVPPDDKWFAEVKQLGEHEAVATVHVSRFAPDDDVRLPPKGMVFTSRREDSGSGTMACGLDTSAPVRATITAVIAPKGGPQFDDDGFAYIELDLDQGSAEGLAVGDELYFDQNDKEDLWGEGRVRRVTATSSRVLWRSQRWHESQEVEWPAQGQHLVTPAWRRYESEVFGSLGK